MKNMVQNFVKNTSISKKILIMFLFFCVIPMILFFMLTISEVIQLANSRLLRSVEQSMEQTVLLIQSRLDTMLTTSEIIIKDRNLEEQLANIYTTNYTMAHQIEDYQNLSEFIHNLERNDYIYNIRLYLPDWLMYSKEGINYCNINQCRNEYNYDDNYDGVQYIINDSYDYAGKSVPVISLVRSLHNPSDYAQRAAVLKISTRYDDISQIIRDEGAVVEGELAYIRNSDGVITIGSSEAIEGASITGEYNKWADAFLAGKKGYVIEHAIEDVDWTVGCFVPYSTIISVMVNHILSMFVIIVLIAICAYSFAWHVSKQSKKRIDIITENMKEVQGGNLSVTISDMGQDDVGIIVNNFNKMVCRLAVTIERKAESDRMLAESQSNFAKAELLALQSQINPHFLYNTLEFINWIAIRRDFPELEELVAMLSRFYRQSLGKEGSMVTLESECRHVESYIKIQNIRFGDTVELIEDIDEVRDCRLPRITLQPLVENSFVHGFKNLGNCTGVIKITGKQRGGIIIVTVEDNGKGMSDEKINDINHHQYDSIGIKNISTRLVLSFGKQYGLRYEKPETGAKAVIEFPAVRE